MIKKNLYEKNIQKKCHVCEQQVAIDQYGNGNSCSVCGWEQNNRGWEFPDRVIFPNMMSLNKAKRLFSEGKPLKPDLDDFIGGLMFYSEMKFTHNNIDYSVHFLKDDIVIYNTKTKTHTVYKDEIDFAANANINGAKLRDIWHEVENASFML